MNDTYTVATNERRPIDDMLRCNEAMTCRGDEETVAKIMSDIRCMVGDATGAVLDTESKLFGSASDRKDTLMNPVGIRECLMELRDAIAFENSVIFRINNIL